MSFNVILQLTLEVECFLADGTFPILDPFVDHLMLGPCRGSPEGLFATKPALVLLLPGVLGHVHSQVVLRVAGELAVRTGERVRRRLVRDFLVQVVTASGQILRVANVTLEGKNTGVPKDVIFESHFSIISPLWQTAEFFPNQLKRKKLSTFGILSVGIMSYHHNHGSGFNLAILF